MTGTDWAPLPPGSWLGVLGGGQLGRMFAQAAQRLGYRVCVLDPDADCIAGRVADRLICADYEDERGLAELGRLCAAVTTEFENVPAAALNRLAGMTRVAPAAASVAVAQDRVTEKAFIQGCGVPVAPYVVIDTPAAISEAPDSLFPAILKVARLGYDGKGQARVSSREEAGAALSAFTRAAGGRVPVCVLEQMVPLACEVSVLTARDGHGNTVVYPLAGNEHRDGILAVSTVPALVSDEVAAQAREAALTIVERMQYTGVLCIEFFVLTDGRVLANEMAPRPHNSGHWTIDGAGSSQFDQQARVMAGLPLGDATQIQPALMLNILGNAWFDGKPGREGAELPDWPSVLAHPGARLHLYGKNDARRGRKMGHVTVVGATMDEVRQQAEAIGPLVAQPLTLS
ncbi:MAG: 5-(carboxyamino)imidazole ribonucleotide synthase [Lautropia sp.]|nr:5-(carboxyamino)imidazole ribonucleotide synthase [Lautropia sp.]